MTRSRPWIGRNVQWFRFYDEALDDAKVQQLPPALFKHWVGFLCLANKGTPRGTIRHDCHAIAFRLRVSESEVCEIVGALVDYGLLEISSSGRLVPHNWDNRQRKSDSSAERVAAHRGRLKGSNDTETLQGRYGNGHTEEKRGDAEKSNDPPIAPPGGKETDSSGNAGVKPSTARPRTKSRERDNPYWNEDDHLSKFGEWYREYPRKVDPQGAMKAWREVLGNADSDERTMQALWVLSRERWREWRSRESRHIPHPATWLNKREWEFTRAYQESEQ